jgi:hypothetical protein
MRCLTLEDVAVENNVLILDNCVLGGSLRDSYTRSKSPSKRFYLQAESYSFWIKAILAEEDFGVANITSDIKKELVINYDDKKKIRNIARKKNYFGMNSLCSENESLVRILEDDNRIIKISDLNFDLYYNLSNKFEPMFESISKYLLCNKKSFLSIPDKNLLIFASTILKSGKSTVSVVSNDKGVSLGWKGIVDFYSEFRHKLGFYRREDRNAFVYGLFK